MVLITPVMRMGHSEGQTDVCYDEAGKFILTCGSDGDVRVWQGMDDDDPQTIDVGESSAAMALRKGRLFVGSDANTVQAYTFPKGHSDGIISRFTAPVTHLSVSCEGRFLVAGSSDFTIKVSNLEETSQHVLEGHTAPILSVAIDPQLQYVASSSCDGTLKIWSLATETLEKSALIIPKCSDISVSRTLCRMSWKPGNGKYLAVPVEKRVQLYERETWNVAFSLEPKEEDGFLSVVAWSPCENFLATASTNGSLCIWDVQKRNCIERTKHKKALSICSLAWNPRGNQEIAFTDIMGQVGVYEVVKSFNKDIEIGKPTVDCRTTDSFDNDADEDLLAALKQAEDLQDDMADCNDSSIHEDIGPPNHKMFSAQEKTAAIDFSDGETSTNSATAGVMPREKSAWIPSHTKLMQKSFIPGSTPVHLSSRFMKWNSVGIVRCYETDNKSSIDVEFHDASVHHALHIDNHYNYTMAELAANVVLLAAESNEDSPSQLMCYHLLSWDNQKEWSTVMPRDESIKALGIGDEWIAVATDKRMVRLYTTSGIQREIFSLPGPVICMAAHGQQLLVAYHAGIGIPEDQCIGVRLLTVMQKKPQGMYEGQLPLSPKTTLVWFGFSAEGTAACVDSDGVVRLFNHVLQSWIPLAHIKQHCKGHSDFYWVVGIHEQQQQLRCIPCKGAPFPPTLPRPSVTVLPLELPLCELDTEKGQLEEAYWRSHFLNYHFQLSDTINESSQKKIAEEHQDTIMKLFALSCRSDRECRAYDVCQFMTSAQSVSLAIKYASRSQRITLAKRLSNMASQLMIKEQEDTDEEIDDQSQRFMVESHVKNFDHNDHAACSNDENRVRSCKKKGTNIFSEEENDQTLCSKTLKIKSAKVPFLLPSSQGRKNPFKKQIDKLSSNPRGTNVFDEMEKSIEGKSHENIEKESLQKQRSSGAKKMKTQAMLLGSKAQINFEKSEQPDSPSGDGRHQGPSGFNLWLQKNRESLSKQNPSLAGSELIKLAMQMWRCFSDDERENWDQKSSDSIQQSHTEYLETVDPAQKKRKRLDNETTGKRSRSVTSEITGDKQSRTVAASTKLASFVFHKD